METFLFILTIHDFSNILDILETIMNTNLKRYLKNLKNTIGCFQKQQHFITYFTYIELLRPEFKNLNTTKRAKSLLSVFVYYIELIENKPDNPGIR